MKEFSLIFVFVPVVLSRKILSSDSSASSAEILNSSVRNLDDFTLCGRLFSHQFSSSAQTLLHIATEEWKQYTVGLGTLPVPCDESYFEGKNILLPYSIISI